MPKKQQSSLRARGMKNQNVGYSTNSKHDHTSRPVEQGDDLMEVAKETSSRKGRKSTHSKKSSKSK